ncbi:multiple sugar transport system substrate-binding protein [Amycolatopsis sacchari]|uniref:Multiple sugar transport system substrate-binding protein n=1 Tax=Amycolatopsis sacchari TaxID=115433 RepID=A0A1I3YCG1_9PSEU|nr:sugar ABC transporter substrate-binding protein [Amycolatopsis sacchari]SFK29554.1 multiple sugar transport system substrate-binding protein [Amycolatopsis sacchari]
MRSSKTAAVLAVLLLALGITACGSGSSSSDGKTLTYWASNQAGSLEEDRQILQPELDKFEQQTGIHVNLEVIAWPDLLNRILTATTSGSGPDVLNIGNTWSASLQATGALQPFDDATFAKVGGREKFLATSMAATGAAGQPPAAVPLYGLAYGLFYNKKKFADAGLQPPTTWQELVDDAKRLTDAGKGQWGMGIEGASYTEGAHFAFMFGRQHGAQLFQGDEPGFDSPQMVAGIKQYVDLLSSGVVNPSDAEHQNNTELMRDFASGKTAMIMFQNNAVQPLKTNGMDESQYGVVPIPVVDPLPPGGAKVSSHVAGINIAAFAGSKNLDGALKFINFMTGIDEQKVLNGKLGSLPVVSAAYQDPQFQTPLIGTFRQVLANAAESMPMIPKESQFETLIGTAVKELMASAASGTRVDDAAVKAKLTAANQQMKSGG